MCLVRNMTAVNKKQNFWLLPSTQESYAMLHKYELLVAKEEADKVDTLRYTWEKLLSRSTEVQNELVALQPNFRGELVSNVEIFLEDCQQFYQDYEKVKKIRKCRYILRHLQTTYSMVLISIFILIMSQIINMA